MPDYSTDISKLLYNSKIESKTLLDNLTKTLEFEKSLGLHNEISLVFEPYLSIWVHEQDKYLNSKMLEFSAVPQLPPDVPNIAVSSTELFKIFNRLLSHITKLTNGDTIVDLARVFNKYLLEYNRRILAPILSTDDFGAESLKYFTMLLNTGDYIINNIEELADKIQKRQHTIAPFNTDAFYQLINKSISSLLLKMSIDYKPCWREFLIWIGAVGFGERYFVVHERFEEQDRRELEGDSSAHYQDSYVRNFNDKLVEMLVTTIANNLKFVKPMTATSVEQILMDVSSLKEDALRFPLFSVKDVSKSYQKFVNHQFGICRACLSC